MVNEFLPIKNDRVVEFEQLFARVHIIVVI